MKINKKAWGARIGLLISIVALWLFLKDLKFKETWDALKQANYLWVIPATISIYGSLVARAFRWRIFLGPEHRDISLFRLFNTLTIGFFGNSVLPGRAGEFLRAYMLARSEKVGFFQAFATIVVERVFDLFGLITGIILLFVLSPFPKDVVSQSPELFTALKSFGWSVAVISFGMAAFLFIMVRMPVSGHKILIKVTFFLPDPVQSKLVGSLESFISGLSIFKDLKRTFLALFWTWVVWFTILFNEYLLIQAFGFEVSLVATLLLMVTLAFAVAMPQAPGYLGPFHVASEKTLVAFYNVTVSKAKAFAIVLWFAQMIPIILLGLVCLHFEGITLGEIWRSIRARDEEEAGEKGASESTES
jgi:glycosyltransferase 2 family protein